MSLIRDHFPILRNCVYLNSNSTGAIPYGVQAVLDQYWETLKDWRDDVWEGWLDQLDSYCEALALFIGAPSGTVVSDANTSTLLSRVVSCFDFTPPRTRVITTDLEFPSVPFILRAFARYGAELDVVGSDGPRFDEATLEERIDERTALVCVSHGSYVSGAVIDLPRIVKRAHEVGALVLVDAFQTIGAVPLDVCALDVDFVLGGAHKWLCGAGLAFLYVKADLLPTLTPAATGWFAASDPLTFMPSTEWADNARRFAGGTPYPLTALVSRVGLDLLSGVGIEEIRAHSLRCTDRIVRRAADAGIRVVGPTDPHRRGGVVCLSFPRSELVKKRLAEQRIICSWRGALRIAPHIYNTIEEVDILMDTIDAERRRAPA